MLRKSLLSLSLIGLLFTSCNKNSNSDQQENKMDSLIVKQTGDLSFYIISDWGRNGYYFQKDVAQAMAFVADNSEGPDFIISCGDNFQVNGVASVDDPLWISSFESVYSHPTLLVDWFPCLGNHDYKGNTQAQIDYSKKSRRWKMNAHYYSFSKEVTDSIHVRFICLDTPALLKKYRNDSVKYPDACHQDSLAQLLWLEETLKNTTEEWIIVYGHHPIFSASKKHGDEEELKKSILPLLEKYKVDFYLNGHDHDFQHLAPKDTKVEFLVNGTGATVRETATNKHSLVSLSEPGFTRMSISNDSIFIQFINTQSKVVYKYAKSVN